MSAHRLGQVLIVIAVLTMSNVVWAGPQARLNGTVTDSSGKPIATAVVTITSEEIPTYKKVVQVEADGSFKALILDATRTYIFSVEAPGFLTHKEEFKIPVGTTDNEFEFALKTQAENSAQRQQELLEQPGYKQYDEGRSLLEQGRRDEAKQKFEEAVALVPDLLPAWIELLELAYEGGDYERAMELAERCLELDDEALQCLGIAANSAENLGRSDDHQRYMTRYQELNPDDPATLFNQAVEYLNKMDDDAARPLLEECLAVDADFPKCLFEYGMLLLRSGETQGAKEKLQRYLEVAPDGADAATAADTVKWL